MVLSVKEVHQKQQEGCLRMSSSMQNNIYRELRGQIPGLQGDPRFGATVFTDINASAIVEKIAIAHHCDNCPACNAAIASDSSVSSDEGI